MVLPKSTGKRIWFTRTRVLSSEMPTPLPSAISLPMMGYELTGCTKWNSTSSPLPRSKSTARTMGISVVDCFFRPAATPASPIGTLPVSRLSVPLRCMDWKKRPAACTCCALGEPAPTVVLDMVVLRLWDGGLPHHEVAQSRCAALTRCSSTFLAVRASCLTSAT